MHFRENHLVSEWEVLSNAIISNSHYCRYILLLLLLTIAVFGHNHHELIALYCVINDFVQCKLQDETVMWWWNSQLEITPTKRCYSISISNHSQMRSRDIGQRYGCDTAQTLTPLCRKLVNSSRQFYESFMLRAC